VRAVVTGATGLIGNAIATQLVAAGHPVRALVRSVSRARGMIDEQVELVRGDVTDPASLREAMVGADVVFHAARLPNQWVRDPSLFDRVNREGTEHVLAAAFDSSVSRVVYTSTVEMFGADPDGVVREDVDADPERKLDAYERSKQAAARVATEFAQRGLEVVLLCPGGMYGPGPTRTALNGFVLALLNEQVPLVPPGGCSIAYAPAVAAAHLVAAEHAIPGERYLVADGYVTMGELAAAVTRTAELNKVPRNAPAGLFKVISYGGAVLGRVTRIEPPIPPGVLRFLLWQGRIDASKAKRELGYQPVALDEGLAATVAFWRERGVAGQQLRWRPPPSHLPIA
jgi:dihydroflavonol-4-reductase